MDGRPVLKPLGYETTATERALCVADKPGLAGVVL